MRNTVVMETAIDSLSAVASRFHESDAIMVEGATIPCPKCSRVAIAHLARALEVCIAESLGTSLGSASRGRVPQDGAVK